MSTPLVLPLQKFIQQSSNFSVYSKRIWPPTGAIYAGQAATYTLPNYGMSNKAVYFNRTKKFRPGKFVVNPFDLRTFNTRGSLAEVWLKEPFGGPWVNQVLVTGHIASIIRGYKPNIDLSQLAQNDNYALPVLTSAAAKVAAAEADVALMIAEAGQTLQLLTSPMTGFLKLWRKFNQGGPATVRLRAKYLASKWLEYRYGVLPLVSDICSIIDTYDRRFTNKSPLLKSTKHREWIVDSRSITNEATYIGAFSNWFAKHQRSTEVKYSVSSHVYFTNHLYERRLNLDVGSIPGLLWELIPYSFVVDWVLNVGDWLAAIKPKPGITILGNTICYKRVSTETTFINKISSYSDFRWWLPCYSTHVQEQEQVLRVVNTLLPSYPMVNVSWMNLNRYIDSFSLIWQQLPNKRR